MALVSLNNISKPAPRWFRKGKKAVLIIVVAANAMIASWGLEDQLLAARLQLWCTIGFGALAEALESLLANGEEYVSTKESGEDNKPI